MQRKLLLFAILFFQMHAFAQTIKIPAYTGYSVPAEKDEESLFTEKNGLSGWTNAKQKIKYFFYLRKAGKLSIELETKNISAGTLLNLAIDGKNFPVKVPASPSFKMVSVGSLIIKDSGYYTITLTVIKKVKQSIADIRSIQLSGVPTQNSHFNSKPRRNAASVHLRYPLEDSIKAIAFYNEITVPSGYDPVHSYFMATGFARGYFGIQVNSEKERRVIFSVWDAGNEAIDRNKVADSNKVQLLAKGADVFADGFGNEGTGGHSHWVYPWKTDQVYQFLVTSLADSASQTTIYTGYFFLPELKKWKLIASFRAPKDGKNLRNLYSFNENFWGINGQLQRKALYGNQWVQNTKGQWIELTKSNLTYDATGRAGDRIDFGGGVDNGKFYLYNGGFILDATNYRENFSRTATNQKPVIDLNNHADSVYQSKVDKQMIMDAISKHQLDTTGSVDGVYYQILKEGFGAYVSVNDTVTVFYKGSLLKDGSIFDQTKEKPASFPLKRLIRGWQQAVPMCKVGGKIRIIIPSANGYTIRSRSNAIPPNSVLVFDIEVVNAKKAM